MYSRISNTVLKQQQLQSVSRSLNGRQQRNLGSGKIDCQLFTFGQKRLEGNTALAVSSDHLTSSSKCLQFKRHRIKENTKLRSSSVPKAYIVKHRALSLKSRSCILRQSKNGAASHDVVFVATPPFALATSINRWKFCASRAITNSAGADK